MCTSNSVREMMRMIDEMRTKSNEISIEFGDLPPICVFFFLV